MFCDTDRGQTNKLITEHFKKDGRNSEWAIQRRSGRTDGRRGNKGEKHLGVMTKTDKKETKERRGMCEDGGKGQKREEQALIKGNREGGKDSARLL